MRGLFVTSGVVLMLAAALCFLLFFVASGPYGLGWSILAAGFAVAGSLCFIAAALSGSDRGLKTSAPLHEFEDADT